ncbi:MAG: hypothetical protein HY986_06715 [Candidatus Melainabacteria bacterium]|nr:hypothetical protein [Candidatus Melainabacteria bacterium]
MGLLGRIFHGRRNCHNQPSDCSPCETETQPTYENCRPVGPVPGNNQNCWQRPGDNQRPDRNPSHLEFNQNPDQVQPQPAPYRPGQNQFNNRQSEVAPVGNGTETVNSLRVSETLDLKTGKRGFESATRVSGEIKPESRFNESTFIDAANQAAREGKPIVMVIGNPATAATRDHLSKAWSMQNGHYEQQGRPDTRRHYKDEAVFVNIDPAKVKEGSLLSDLLKEQKLDRNNSATLILAARSTSDGASLSVKERFDQAADPFRLIAAHDQIKAAVKPVAGSFSDNTVPAVPVKPGKDEAPQKPQEPQARPVIGNTEVKDNFSPHRNGGPDTAVLPQSNFAPHRPVKFSDALAPQKPAAIMPEKPAVAPEKPVAVVPQKPAVTPEKPVAVVPQKPAMQPEKPLQLEPSDFAPQPIEKPRETPEKPVAATPEKPAAVGPQNPAAAASEKPAPAKPVETANLPPQATEKPAEISDKERAEAEKRIIAEVADQIRDGRIKTFDRFYENESIRSERASRTLDQTGTSQDKAREMLGYDDMNLISFNSFKKQVEDQYGFWNNFNSRSYIKSKEDVVSNSRDEQWANLKKLAADQNDPNYKHKQVLLAEIARGMYLPPKEGEKVSYYHDDRMATGNQIIAPRAAWQKQAAETLAAIAADPKADHEVVARVLPEIMANPFIPAETRIAAMKGMVALAGDTTSSFMDVRTKAEKQAGNNLAVVGTPREVAIASILKAMHRDNNHYTGKPNAEVQKAGMEALLQLKACETLMQLHSLGKRSPSPQVRQAAEDYSKKIAAASQPELLKLAEMELRRQMQPQAPGK